MRQTIMVGLLIGVGAMMGYIFLPLPKDMPQTSSAHGLTGEAQEVRYVGRCSEPVLNSMVEVYTAKYIGDQIGGDFSSTNPPAIRLVETSLKTVAHEASHLTDHLLLERGIHDDETEAYLQGFYTECLYDWFK